jgi:hypothetical protein
MQTELLLVLLFTVIIASGIALSPVLGASDQTITTSLSLPTQTIPDFNFVAIGDWGCNSNTNNTVNNILDKKPELVLALGDYSYNNTDDCWFKIVDPIDEIMKIAIGNHDIGNMHKKLHNYTNYFGLEEQYYSFNYQNVHFTVMSTELLNASAAKQYNFVTNDLSKAASDPNIDWIVVYFHRPLYTSPTEHPAENTLTSKYHPMFDKYGVDIVLQGHNHNYQRSYPIKYNSTSTDHPIITTDINNINNYTNSEGPIFVTVGTGGATLYNLTGKAPYIATQHVGYGILNVDVINNGKTLNVKFDEDVDGIVKDQFTITKSGDDDLPLPLPADLSAQVLLDSILPSR